MLSSIIRVLVVDDYEPWIRFVSTALAVQPRINVVGEARDGLTAIQKVAELKPDVVVLDIGLPDMNGIQVAAGSWNWRQQPTYCFSRSTLSRKLCAMRSLPALRVTS